MKTVCCVCRRTKGKQGWKARKSRARWTNLSHGYCPDCYQEIMARLAQRSASGTGWQSGSQKTLFSFS